MAGKGGKYGFQLIDPDILDLTINFLGVDPR